MARSSSEGYLEELLRLPDDIDPEKFGDVLLHDLKQPAASIRTAAHLIENTKLDYDELVVIATIVEQSGQRLTEMLSATRTYLKSKHA